MQPERVDSISNAVQYLAKKGKAIIININGCNKYILVKANGKTNTYLAYDCDTGARVDFVLSIVDVF